MRIVSEAGCGVAPPLTQWGVWWLGVDLTNKPSGKKILNTTFYPDQKGINKFINGKSELKGNKQVKKKNLKLENAKNIVRMTKRLCDYLCPYF